MNFYKNIDSGEIYTTTEIKELYYQFKDELKDPCESFDNYLDSLLAQCREKSGGLEPVEMHYLLDIVENTPHRPEYRQTIETGETDFLIDLEAVASEYTAPEDGYIKFIVNYYAPGHDPLFDEPDYTDELTI